MPPKVSRNLVQPDRVANFVEVSLGQLRLPQELTATLYTYRVEVSCRGASAASMPVHRPQPSWSAVLKVDPDLVSFEGCTLFLPLPPGFWVQPERRPTQLRLSVARRPSQDLPPMNYGELLNRAKAAGGRRAGRNEDQDVFHAMLSLRELSVDEPVTGVPVPLGSTAEGEGALLVLNSVVLRDRESAWMASGDACDGESPCPLCVGGQASLRLEEALAYPGSRAEFRARLHTGSWDGARADTLRSVPLREPSLLHEFVASGLGEVPGSDPFRPRPVPDFCELPVPHKYVLPPSEVAFRQRRLPGVFWRVASELASQHEYAPEKCTQDEPAVVFQLSHLQRDVPCTVIAVYADRTADVELSPEFLRAWEEQSERRFLVPGNVRSYQPGGEASQPARVLIKGVHCAQLSALHSAGFNVYDAALQTSEEVVQEFIPAPPPAVALRAAAPRTRAAVPPLRRVAAGPLPPDASPDACQYEWSLHLCAASEAEARRFLALLQQCVRIDHSQRTKRLAEYLAKAGKRTLDTSGPGSPVTRPSSPLSAGPPTPFPAASPLRSGPGSPTRSRAPPGSGILEVLICTESLNKTTIIRH